MRPPQIPPPRRYENIAIAICRVCGAQFNGPRLDPAKSPGESFFAYLGELAGHVRDKHVEHAAQYEEKGKELFGMLIIEGFKTNDPALIDQRNFYRWQLHNATTKVSLPDDQLEMRVEEAITRLMQRPKVRSLMTFDPMGVANMLKAEAREELRTTLKALRDELLEAGLYTVDTTPSPIIKV